MSKLSNAQNLARSKAVQAAATVANATLAPAASEKPRPFGPTHGIVVTMRDEMQRNELVLLRSRTPTVMLDPKLIRSSAWGNRHDDSFKTAEFQTLKLEIESAGGNVQAIKVRLRAGTPGEFEIVFGHRRHRACLELGLLVRAVIEPLSDAELFIQMDRENRNRKDLSPWEQGVMYSRALDEGLFPSIRKMADALGADQSNATKAVALARLPIQVVSAFASPLDIQQAWASKLWGAVKANPDAVLNRADALAKMAPKPSAANVLKELIGGGEVSNLTLVPESVSVKGKGGKVGKIGFNPEKKTFEISLSGLESGQMQAIEQAIRALIS